MLKISKLTDYSLVLLVAMAREPSGALNARQLTERTALPLPTVSKCLKALVHHGFCHSSRGPAGGYQLNGTAHNLAIMDVIQALEGPLALTACTSHQPQCRLSERCQLRPHWHLINDLVCKTLATVYLDQLITPTHGRSL